MTIHPRDDDVAVHALVHDLRGPLGAIMGYAEFMADIASTEPERAVRFARTVADTAHRLTEQIDRMLGAFALTARPLAPETVDVVALAREVADEVIARHGVTRTVEVVLPQRLEVRADPVLTRVLLDAVLDNAVKFTGPTEDPRIELRHLDDSADGLVTIAVRDNGVGFDPTFAERMFQPLGRLHDESRFPGYGLGLVSARRIVEHHGGTISADGAPGVGAEIRFSLPTV